MPDDICSNLSVALREAISHAPYIQRMELETMMRFAIDVGAMGNEKCHQLPVTIPCCSHQCTGAKLRAKVKEKLDRTFTQSPPIHRLREECE